MGGQTWLVEALAAAIFTSLKLGTEVRETATVSGKASLSTSRYPKKEIVGHPASRGKRDGEREHQISGRMEEVEP